MVNSYDNINLYVFAGAGGIMSRSTIKDQDGTEPLENLGYYPNLQYTAAFPVGAGFKFSLDPRWSVAAELDYKFTVSDRLDGYQPDASNYKDSYYMLTVRAVMRIRNDRNGVPQFGRYYH
jgi:hypothetical protein